MAYVKLFCALYVKVVSLTLNVKSFTNYFIAIVFNTQKQPGKQNETKTPICWLCQFREEEKKKKIKKKMEGQHTKIAYGNYLQH